jgi:hypothetical protein
VGVGLAVGHLGQWKEGGRVFCPCEVLPNIGLLLLVLLLLLLSGRGLEVVHHVVVVVALALWIICTGTVFMLESMTIASDRA